MSSLLQYGTAKLTIILKKNIQKLVMLNKTCGCDMPVLQETPTNINLTLANDNDCRINNHCHSLRFKARSKTNKMNKSPAYSTILENFIEKNGQLPNPHQASTIGKLTGSRIKASDGKLYPKPTKSEQISAKLAREERKKYHTRTESILKIKLALECLSNGADPAELAFHVKNASDVGERLDFALDWLRRFAKELGKRGKACCQ